MGRKRKLAGVDVDVRQGKAYVSVQYRGNMITVSGEPLFVVDLSLESLLEAIGKAHDYGNPPIQQPEAPQELRKWLAEYARRSPLPKLAGVRTWKEFAQKARAYYICWYDDKIQLGISGAANRSGAFLWERVQEFAPDTSLDVVVQALLEEIRRVPELWERAEEGTEPARLP